MRMLTWILGVTRMDRVRNYLIRGTTEITEVSKKIQERRMNWYGHVKRQDERYVGRSVAEMELVGRR